ncbi:hypothetical protein GLA29479_963 [Lysobacter antibioticus]|nr:hypothetical protein GLA29479_963 [Lysobacter antibioticus]
MRWLDAHTLEVAVPPGTQLKEKRTQDRYSGYALRYVYRKLKRNEPAWAGCGIPKRAY